MFLTPSAFQNHLSTNNNNHIDEIYDAMAKDDPAEVVITVLKILKRTDNVPFICKNGKSESISAYHRNLGNAAYHNGSYQRSLICYNQALLFAPINSREMKLAYSNRSALFLELKLFNECNTDIEMCFSLGCPPDIRDKLLKRKENIRSLITMEEFSRNIMQGAAEKCINYRTMSHNSQIQCASTHVKADTATVPKIVASVDINVGTVVALEQAYVSFTDIVNSLFSCHFCQKKSLNLIPCDSCVYALFCNDECKKKCITEFHIYECKIMEAIRDMCLGPKPNLMIKASLKLKAKTKSWKELIDASYKTGICRIQSSSVTEIYDSNSIYSILTYKDDKPFKYGALYNASFICASLLHYLDENIPSFLPKNMDEKQQALMALARIMMYLSIYQIPNQISQAQTNVKLDRSNYGADNFGLFPFTGKLKNSCNPNLLAADINNKLVLITIQPIKCEEELSISYICHKQDTTSNTQEQNVKTFIFYGTVGNCPEHKNESCWDDNRALSKTQKKFFSQLNIREMDAKLKNLQVIDVYHTTLKALSVLKNVPNSKEYKEIYRRFRKCIFYFEVVNADNNVLDNNI